MTIDSPCRKGLSFRQAMKAGEIREAVHRGAAFLNFKSGGEAMKKQDDPNDPFVYWSSLLVYLKNRGDVAYIKSITIKEGQFTHGPVGKPIKCIHEASVSYRKTGRVRLDSAIKPGHIEECTWID
ncbi:MAG: hypothetical protein NTZ26_12030 [Candidatus Aminicenantes bacterium]|nr:hypothetical protein [Candidatus Aminicenantes bacterium]